MRALFAFVGLLSAAAAIARFAMWWSARRASRFRDKVLDQLDEWRRQDDEDDGERKRPAGKRASD